MKYSDISLKKKKKSFCNKTFMVSGTTPFVPLEVQ
jgi:hypothetical protein